MTTALGSLEETVSSMERGESGLKYDNCHDLYLGRAYSMYEKIPDFGSIVIPAIKNVLSETGLSLKSRDTLLIISTTKGNINSLAGHTDNLPEEVFISSSVKRIGLALECANPPIAISNACISGISAMITGRNFLLSGKYRHAIIAGCDMLSDFVIKGFMSLKALSKNICRPYDASRDGIVLGEACGAVLLTTDACIVPKPAIRLLGGAITNDANHISGPSRDGSGLYNAIRQACEEAGVESGGIGFINTHGTATLYNDDMESLALRTAGLSDTPVNALKGYIGHTLGASGIVESILCAHQLRKGRIFGTYGFSSPGTASPVKISAAPQEISTGTCLKTASGFGGCNAAIVLGNESAKDSAYRHAAKKCKSVTVSSYCLERTNTPFCKYIRKEYGKLSSQYPKFFKMSDLCKAVFIAASHLRIPENCSGTNPERIAVILAGSMSSIEADIMHQNNIENHPAEGASPSVFVYTLPNITAGELCIKYGITGDNTFFIAGKEDTIAERYAGWLIENGKADAAICGWCDKLGQNWDVKLKLLKRQK